MSVPNAVRNDLTVLTTPEHPFSLLRSGRIHFLQSVLLMHRILWKVSLVSSQELFHSLPVSLDLSLHLQSFAVIDEYLFLISGHPVCSCGTGNNPVPLFWS